MEKTLCDTLGIKGKILISAYGINGTLGCHILNLKIGNGTSGSQPLKKFKIYI